MAQFAPYIRRLVMNNQEMNLILELRRSGASFRSIAESIHLPISTIHDFLTINADITHITTCPVCHKLIRHKSTRGRKRIYCSDKCRYSRIARKTHTRICLNCNKSFSAYSYSKAKFCSSNCYRKYRYGR